MTAPRGRKSRDLPPLLTAAVSMILLLATLPSALNLPQDSPSETLEYAPVPPDDDSPPSEQGNLSTLGLGRTSSFGASSSEGLGDGGGGGGGGAAGGGAGKNPSTKRCVGEPPRQTEDLLAPPCVAFFNGDNGGATYRGVTGEEIRILFYMDVRFYSSSRGMEQTPSNRLFDLDKPPAENETDPHLRALRAYQRYFNDRYQTYGRRAHFFAYYGRSGSLSAEEVAANAAENFRQVQPFAVISIKDEHQETYLRAMARYGVLNFGSFLGRSEAFFAQYPKLVWGFLPSVEQQARSYGTYICQRVVPFPVSFSGMADHQGRPRKLGLLYTTDPDFPGMRLFADEVRRLVEGCGGRFVAEATFPIADSTSNTQPPAEAQQAMAEFQTAGVTTIVRAQGYETNMTKAAANIGYLPEWIAAGDTFNEGNSNAKFQDQTAWSHAFVVTPVTKILPKDEEHCTLAVREGQPEFAQQDVFYACILYPGLRQLFTGIQVAGPRLGPASIDRGFRAIPAIESPDPTLPACYYVPGDFTCVKDGVAEWWDPEGPDETQSGVPGCWRMPQGGKRYLPGRWPESDVATERRPDDPCNAYVGFLNLG